jgi:hypothetical protein
MPTIPVTAAAHSDGEELRDDHPIWCSASCAPDILSVSRLTLLLIAAVVVLSLPACGNGNGASESSSKTSGETSGESSSSESSSSGAALLPRDVIIPLSTVQDVLPEMTQETATGPNQTVVGNPTANRAVTYASADGSQRAVISVDKYNSPEEASSAYQEASQKSQEVPGVSGSETVSDLGDGAFIGVVTQGDETHVGGGALYGDLIVAATLQGYDGTDENKAKVTELLRKQGDTAQQVM